MPALPGPVTTGDAGAGVANPGNVRDYLITLPRDGPPGRPRRAPQARPTKYLPITNALHLTNERTQVRSRLGRG